MDSEIKRKLDSAKKRLECLAQLLKGLEISKSGWGGLLANGQIVDRREHPEAIPIARNSMLGIPEPNTQQKGATR
jgi:hypothetical protein